MYVLNIFNVKNNLKKVNSAIIQKTSSGIHSLNSTLWDDNTDGMINFQNIFKSCFIVSLQIRWENRTMYCIVSIFAVSFE